MAECAYIFIDVHLRQTVNLKRLLKDIKEITTDVNVLQPLAKHS